MGFERSSPEISAPRGASRFLIASDMITPPYKLRVCASRSSHLPPNRRKRELVKLVHSASRERGCGQQGYVSACGQPRSERNATRLDRAFPFLDFGGKKLREILRRAAFRCNHVASYLLEMLLQGRHLQRGDRGTVEPLDDRLRRLRGQEECIPAGRSKLVSPCSCAEGRSGRFDDRVLLRIAIGLTVLPAICGSARGRLTQS